MLTQKRLLELFDVETATGVITRKVSRGNVRAGDVAGCVDGNGYLLTMIDGKTYKNHRLVWLASHARWPVDQLDHINGKRTDNRIANLREVDRQGNNRNAAKRADNSSGITGVYWFKRDRKWLAQIRVDGKLLHLGYFDDLHEAAAVRKAAEKEHDFHPNHGRSAEHV